MWRPKVPSISHESQFQCNFFQAFIVFSKHGFHPMSDIKADKHEALGFTISMNDIILSSHATKCSPKRTTRSRGPFQKHSCVEIYLIHSILIFCVTRFQVLHHPICECCWSLGVRAIKHLHIVGVWLAFCCVGGSLGCSCINAIVVLGLWGVH